jgi:hypothetical protein
MSESLSLGTIAVLGFIILCAGCGLSLHCDIFHSIFSLYSLDASRPSPQHPVVITKTSPDIVSVSRKAESLSSRNTAVREYIGVCACVSAYTHTHTHTHTQR